MRDRFRLIHLIWSVRVLVFAVLLFLSFPTPFDRLSYWPAYVAVAFLLLACASYIAWVRRPLAAFSGSLDLNLAVMAVVALAVKLASSRVPVMPVLFFVLFPVSAFSRKVALAWIPPAILASMAAGRALWSSDPGLVPWAVAFAAFCALFGFTTLRERERYGRMKSAHRRLHEDAEDMMKRIREGDRLQINDRRQHEDAAAYGAIRQEDRLLWDLMKWGRRVFEARTCLLLVPGQPGFLRIRAAVNARGTKVEDRQVPLDKGFLNLAAERGGLLSVGDATAAGGSMPFYPKGVEVGSLLVKVIHDHHVEGAPMAGALYLDSTRTDHFPLDERMRSRLEEFCGLVVDFMSVSAALGHVASDMAAKEAISRHARALTTTLKPNDMARMVLDAVEEALPACEASAFLLKDRELRVVATRGRHFEAMENTVILPEEPSQIGLLLRQLESDEGLDSERKHQIVLNMEQPRKSPFFVRGERIGHINSFAAIPCLQKSGRARELKGVLVVASSKPELISEEAMKDMWTLVDITAPAIDNAFSHRTTDELSRTDGLTGLLNHRTFQMVLESKIGRVERKYTGAISVVMVDADHFKRINDSHGHPVGDEVLRELARRLKTGIRELDCVARYGGEEFALVLENVVEKDVRKICEKLRESVAAEPFPTRAGPLRLTVSIGYCLYRFGEGVGRQDLLDRADQALYHAKKSGRNRVVGFPEI